MKKVFLLSIIAVIGVITAVIVIQSIGNNGDEILNANVEALAWNGSEGGPEVVIPCTLDPKAECEYAELAKGPEGEMIVVGKSMRPGFRNNNGHM